MDEVLYASVDAHRLSVHVTVMDESAKVLRRKRVSSSPGGLREALGTYQEPIKAVVEATHNWGPVYDWLAEITDDVVLTHPAKVRAIADARIKTDTIGRMPRDVHWPRWRAPARERSSHMIPPRPTCTLETRRRTHAART